MTFSVVIHFFKERFPELLLDHIYLKVDFLFIFSLSTSCRWQRRQHSSKQQELSTGFKETRIVSLHFLSILWQPQHLFFHDEPTDVHLIQSILVYMVVTSLGKKQRQKPKAQNKTHIHEKTSAVWNSWRVFKACSYSAKATILQTVLARAGPNPYRIRNAFLKKKQNLKSVVIQTWE